MKSLFWQRLTHKWERTLAELTKDPEKRKELIKRQVAKILANMARNAHRNEETPWDD